MRVFSGFSCLIFSHCVGLVRGVKESARMCVGSFTSVAPLLRPPCFHLSHSLFPTLNSPFLPQPPPNHPPFHGEHLPTHFRLLTTVTITTACERLECAFRCLASEVEEEEGERFYSPFGGNEASTSVWTQNSASHAWQRIFKRGNKRSNQGGEERRLRLDG